MAEGYDSRERHAACRAATFLGAFLWPVLRSLGAILAMKKNVSRALIEVGFIVFLFYANLLMGEFERSGMGQTRGMAWAMGEILTVANFEIAMVAALIGYVLFEFLRKKF
jgi:hypothetical protein